MTTATHSPALDAALLLEAQQLAPQVIDWRRALHRRPEVAFHEHETARFIRQVLEQIGALEISRPTETSVMARLRTGRPGPVLAVRADIDALPIHEENDVEYRSQTDGAMHACGHDGHTSIALGLVTLLARHRDQLRGEVRFILQDAGATTYFLYFDITQNGAKPANPQTPINGNFESGGAGTALPPGWSLANKVEATLDSEIRPSENPSITSDGTNLISSPRTTDGTPRTGQFSYLLGARTNNEVGTGQNRITLERLLDAHAPGSDHRLTAIALTALVDGLWLELSLGNAPFTPDEATALAARWLAALLPRI